MNSVYYCEQVLQNGLLRDIRRQSGAHYIFLQNGAPAHRSRHTVAFLTENFPEFIKPDNCPTPIVQISARWIFRYWGYLQQLAYRQKIRNIQHLKDVIIDCWSEISQPFIDGAIDLVVSAENP